MSALRQLGWVFLAWVLSESRGLVGPKSSRCSKKCLRPERSVGLSVIAVHTPPVFVRWKAMCQYQRWGRSRWWWGSWWPASTLLRPTSERVELSFGSTSNCFALPGQYSRLPELPYTPGTDAAGFVHQIGRRVSTIKVGCWVNDLQTPVTCYLAGWGPSVCIWQ